MTKPRVKPMEWVKHPSKDIWRAIVGFGVYKVFGITYPSWDFDSWSDAKDKISKPAPTIEAAKAAAQADYEARVLAALDMTPDPAVQALVDSQRELARWVAAESWRISGLVSNNDEAMRVHVQIGKMFGSLQGAKNPAVQALVEAAREVYRISERDHVAWRKLSEALAAFDKT